MLEKPKEISVTKPNDAWTKTLFTYVWVFNVGRGLSVFVRLPHNIGLLYDLGSSDDFAPTDFVGKEITPRLTKYSERSLSQLFLSHPHADHIAEVGKITAKGELDAALITCPNEKCPDEAVDWSRLERDDNHDLLAAYKKTCEKRNPPLQTLNRSLVACWIPNVEYGLYYMRPPLVSKEHEASDQHYGNGLSLVVYLRHGYQSILIPGDLTPEVMKKLLPADQGIERRYTYLSGEPAGTPNDFNSRTSSQPSLKTLLGNRGLTILMPPHHGLESCYSAELFNAIKGGKPMLNVISEKRHTGENDGAIHPRYQREDGADGCTVDNEGKKEFDYSISTRNNQHILLVLEGTKTTPRVYLRADPYELLNIQ